MRFLKVRDYDEMSLKGAETVRDRILKKPDMVLGLVTGGTTEGMYKELVKMFIRSEIDFSQLRTVNTDEYYKIEKQDKQSYHYFMNENFFSKVNINPANTFLIDGTASDPLEEAQRYEQIIKSLGGIDLLVLGLGGNGHISFNEPRDDYFNSSTCLVDLTDETLAANLRYFSQADKMPRKAITIGIKTIMQASEILFLVSGSGKSRILNAALNGPITPRVPASVLQLHQNITVIADEAACTYLDSDAG